MKLAGFVPLLVLIPVLTVTVPARAQSENHVEIGAFGDYFHLAETGTNFAGLGGRAAFNISGNVQIEAEMNYDFSQTFNETYTNSFGTTTSVSVVNSNFRALHGLFGPKLDFTKHGVRIFVTAKGGFLNLRFSPVPASFNDFTSGVNNLRENNVSGVLYPGGGIEFFVGPIGIRMEAGDEIAWESPVHNNLRITFGPSIRF